MNNKYKLVYSGRLKADIDEARFIQSFMRLFKVPEATALKLVSLGRSTILKGDLDKLTAEKYREALDNLGMIVRVEPMTVSSQSARVSTIPQQEEAQPSSKHCPKCGSCRVSGDDCKACGIIISRYLQRIENQTAIESQRCGVSAETDPARVHNNNLDASDAIDVRDTKTAQPATKKQMLVVVVSMAIIFESYFIPERLSGKIPLLLLYYVGERPLGVLLAMLPAWFMFHHLGLQSRIQAKCKWQGRLLAAVVIYMVGATTFLPRLVSTFVGMQKVMWVTNLAMIIGSVGVMVSLVAMMVNLKRR